MSDFLGSLMNFLGDAWQAIKDIVEIVQLLFDLVYSCVTFLPSPFREMTYVTVGIITVLVLWRLKR